jgi:hypothetical protein
MTVPIVIAGYSKLNVPSTVNADDPPSKAMLELLQEMFPTVDDE